MTREDIKRALDWCDGALATTQSEAAREQIIRLRTELLEAAASLVEVGGEIEPPRRALSEAAPQP